MNIGILQGRLSPSPDGRFQFFPTDWAAEFAIAKEMGISGIEWLVDKSDPNLLSNPVLHSEGRSQIGRLLNKWGLSVPSIHGLSARYFTVAAGRSLLVSLVDAASCTKDRLLLLSLLEKNAPLDEEQDRQIAKDLEYVVPVLEKLRVTLAFETEMNRDRLGRFLDHFCSPYVAAYYDIGNCTSYGFDCPADIRALGPRLRGVHVKDRKIGSDQSVTLGTGDADIPGCVRALADIGWNGTLIMQAWRTPATYLQDAREQLAYLRNIVKEAL